MGLVSRTALSTGVPVAALGCYRRFDSVARCFSEPARLSTLGGGVRVVEAACWFRAFEPGLEAACWFRAFEPGLVPAPGGESSAAW